MRPAHVPGVLGLLVDAVDAVATPAALRVLVAAIGWMTR